MQITRYYVTMALEQLITLQTYPDLRESIPHVKTLEREGIHFVVDHDHLSFDPSFANNNNFNSYRLQVTLDDLPAASTALRDAYPEMFREELEVVYRRGVDEVNHHREFFSNFTDSELFDVILNRKNWNHQAVQMAKQIVIDRGLVDTEQQLDELIAEHEAESYKPKRAPEILVLVGFALAIFGLALGMALPLYMLFYRHTDPHGKGYFLYDGYSRMLAGLMLVISVTVMTGAIGYLY